MTGSVVVDVVGVGVGVSVGVGSGVGVGVGVAMGVGVGVGVAAGVGVAVGVAVGAAVGVGVGVAVGGVMITLADRMRSMSRSPAFHGWLADAPRQRAAALRGVVERQGEWTRSRRGR